MVVPLAEGKSCVWLVHVWVLPKLPRKLLPYLPVRKKVGCQKLLVDFLCEDWVGDIEKVTQNFRVLLALGDLVNFVHHINKSLELLLRDTILLVDLAR